MIERLSQLTLEKSNLKRLLDCSFNKREHSKLFKQLKEVNKEINEIKFKIRLEKKIKNEKLRKKI